MVDNTGNVVDYYDVSGLARIGGKVYETLQEAINSVSNNDTETIVYLMKNTTESITIPEGKNIKLELGTSTLTSNGDTAIINNGKLKIVSGKIIGNSKNAVRNVGILEISGSTEVIGNTVGNGANLQEWATVYNTSSGTTNIIGGSYDAINKNTIYNDGTMHISGGEITGHSNGYVSVYNTPSGTMNITGGNITSIPSNTVRNDGILYISGTVKISNNNSYSVIWNNSGATATITGGTIISEQGYTAVQNDGTITTIAGANISGTTSGI